MIDCALTNMSFTFLLCNPRFASAQPSVSFHYKCLTVTRNRKVKRNKEMIVYGNGYYAINAVEENYFNSHCV